MTMGCKQFINKNVKIMEHDIKICEEISYINNENIFNMQNYNLIHSEQTDYLTPHPLIPSSIPIFNQNE